MEEPYGNIDHGVLKAIGLVIVNFSHVEEALAFGTTALVVGSLADSTAEFALRRLPFRSLLEVFEGVYRHRFRDDDFRELKQLCEDLTHLNEARNELVHSFWTRGEVADRLSRFRKTVRRQGPKVWDESVSEGDVLKLAVRGDELYGRLLHFVVETILPRIAAGP